jgi:hypothetical protein
MKRAICFALIGVLTTLACAAKEPFKKEETLEVEATITEIYPDSRLLVLNGPAGASVIAAGPEVKNFDQIKLNDKVKVTYKAAFAANISKSKKPAETTVDAAALTAPKGSMPAAAVGQTITSTVKIESVDTSFDTVSFKRPDGLVRTIAVESPEGKKFIRTLKKGDNVDVEYTEALAISVVPGSGM